MTRHFLLTGLPGCGKTTVIRTIAARLQAAGALVRGFWTAEMREGGVRAGFRIETVGGRTGTLARVGLAGPHRVGRYGVDIASFESVGVQEVEEALVEGAGGGIEVLVIDEIGKMELCSPRFREAVARAFAVVPHVVATVMQRSHPWADAVKARPDARLLTVTARNREHLPEEVLRALL